MEIKKVFYFDFLKEVKKGEVFVPYCLNIVFNTLINNKEEKAEINCEDFLVPTLVIEDQENFDKLLSDYVLLGMSFYNEEENLNQSKEETIKKIIAFLFANATFNDFTDPVSFLKKRIDFFNFEEESYSLGRSSILDAEIDISIEKDSIENETPFKFSPVINKSFYLPQIKFGISNNKAYIYAIQNPRVNEEDKKINRVLYKVGEGFDGDRDNFELFEEGNLKDITPSFLVSLNMFLSYLNERQIKDVEIPTILIERWNAKSFAIDKRKIAGKIDEEEHRKLKEKQLTIQSNTTEKLIRTILRIKAHYPSMEVKSFVDESDLSLLLNADNSSKSNNSLLNETSEMMKKSLFTGHQK